LLEREAIPRGLASGSDEGQSMKIHEYQAKEILSAFGVPVPRGIVARSPEEADAAAKRLGSDVLVLKAQIHAGGRGKAGGVQLVRERSEVRARTAAMMSRPLVTHQTGPAGKEIHAVLVEEGCAVAREMYVGIVVDRRLQRPVLMACAEGGVEIEEVAERSPESIHRETVDPGFGLHPFQARRLALAIGLGPPLLLKAQALLTNLARAFVERDASLVEVNPLVVTGRGDLLALDAKMGFDDNALYRHPEAVAYRDLTEENPVEVRASEHDLSYISLEGEIGCLVNGAGLAMATMDIIKLHGGEPANFLDVGGGASRERVTEAFKIILEDRRVKGVLVNIFGGIMKCDVLAQGIVEAVRELGLRVPLVVRLEGTNVEEGRRILAESGLAVTAASDMADAASRIVAAVRASTGGVR
jgi:succinyl-CoA synthetase beta subunit